MIEVHDSNNYHSQIVFCSFTLMFVSIISIVVSVINYEKNFHITCCGDETSTVWSRLAQNDAKSLMSVSSMIINTFFTLLLSINMVNVFYRYKLQIQYDISTKTLTKVDTLITSGYYKYLLVEYLLVLPHPAIWFADMCVKFEVKTFPGNLSFNILYEVNDFLYAWQLLRIFYCLKFFLTLSLYKTSRSTRICRLYGESNSYFFVLRSLFNKAPFLVGFLVFFVQWLLYSVLLRIFERPLIDPVRNLDLQKISYTPLDFNEITNAFWCVFLTMLTIGYGDFYPRTHMGRAIIIIAVIGGLVYISLITVSFFKLLSLDLAQNRVLMLLERMTLRTKYDKLQKTIVDTLMLKHFAFSQLGRIETRLNDPIHSYRNNLELEKKKDEKEYAKVSKTILYCERKLQRTIREKSIIEKNINNMSTAQNVMENIIENIKSIMEDIENNEKRFKKIIDNFGITIKKDDMLIQSIKRKFMEDAKKINYRKMSKF